MNWQELWATLSPIFSGLSLTALVAATFTTIKGIMTIVKQSREIKGLSNKISFVDKNVKAMQEERDAAVEENKLLKQSQAVMFKAISYLVSASRIGTEDKLDILEDIMELKQPLAEATKDDVDKVSEGTTTVVTDIISKAAEKTKTLIDKYTEDK